MEGLDSCLDYFQAVDDPFSKQLQADYAKKFPDTKYLFTAGRASTGMYRGVKFYEAAVKATNGDLAPRGGGGGHGQGQDRARARAAAPRWCRARCTAR